MTEDEIKEKYWATAKEVYEEFLYKQNKKFEAQIAYHMEKINDDYEEDCFDWKMAQITKEWLQQNIDIIQELNSSKEYPEKIL